VNLHKLIFSTEILILAYAGVTKTKGSTTSVGDETKLDGITLDTIQSISKLLLSGS
jgi:hypothetical protein